MLAFKLSAAWVAVETGLLVSEVLSTLPRPTSALTKVRTDLIAATVLARSTALPEVPASVISSTIIGPPAPVERLARSTTSVVPLSSSKVILPSRAMNE